MKHVPCRCPSPACEIDHVREEQQVDFLTDELCTLPAFRDVALADVDEDSTNLERDIRAVVPNSIAAYLWREYRITFLWSTHAQQIEALRDLIEQFTPRPAASQPLDLPDVQPGADSFSHSAGSDNSRRMAGGAFHTEEKAA
jgi:hypothetical protein